MTKAAYRSRDKDHRRRSRSFSKIPDYYKDDGKRSSPPRRGSPTLKRSHLPGASPRGESPRRRAREDKSPRPKRILHERLAYSRSLSPQ